MNAPTIRTWRLMLPVLLQRMQGQVWSVGVQVRIGPFYSQEEMLEWEFGVVKATEGWDLRAQKRGNRLPYAEHRSISGAATAAVTGRSRIEVGVPAGRRPSPFVLSVIIERGLFDNAVLHREGGGPKYDIDPKIVPPLEFVDDLKSHLKNLVGEALEEV